MSKVSTYNATIPYGRMGAGSWPGRSTSDPAMEAGLSVWAPATQVEDPETPNLSIMANLGSEAVDRGALSLWNSFKTNE